MSTQEYIDSGILELYVYGSLSAEEEKEVNEMMTKHPEVKKEIEAIEEAIIRLSNSARPICLLLIMNASNRIYLRKKPK